MIVNIAAQLLPVASGCISHNVGLGEKMRSYHARI